MAEAPLLIGQLILVFFETVAILCIVCNRHRIWVSGLALFAGLCVLTSFRTGVAVVVYVPVLLLGWWGVGHALKASVRYGWVLAAYRWMVGRHVQSAWRKWRLYERRWKRTLIALNLARVIDNGYDEVPKLGRITVSPFGDVLRVKVLPGQTHRDFTGLDGETSRALAKAFKARDCKVTDRPQSDWVTLELPRGDDPLAEVVPFPGAPERAEDVDLSAIPIGVDERGRVVTVPLLGAHSIVGGITGSGKGSYIWSIILHLEPLIREGLVRLWVVDPKRGMELEPGRNMYAEWCKGTDAEIGEFLKRAVTAMDDSADRLTGLGERKLAPTREHPLNVVIIDELGRLSDEPVCKGAIKALVNVGRAPGFSVIGALQTPTKETFKFRDEIPVKVVLRMESAEYVRLMLGRTAYMDGARADDIPGDMPGCGYMKLTKVEGLDMNPPKEPIRFRLFHVPDDLIRATNARFAPEGETEDDGPVDGASVPPQLHVVP